MIFNPSEQVVSQTNTSRELLTFVLSWLEPLKRSGEATSRLSFTGLEPAAVPPCDCCDELAGVEGCTATYTEGNSRRRHGKQSWVCFCQVLRGYAACWQSDCYSVVMLATINPSTQHSDFFQIVVSTKIVSIAV